MKAVVFGFLLLMSCAASVTLSSKERLTEQTTIDVYFTDKANHAPFRSSFYDSVATFAAEHPSLSYVANDVASVRTGDSTGVHSSPYYMLLIREIDTKFQMMEAKP